MIIYGPSREFIYEVLRDSKEFETVDEMKAYIVESYTHEDGIKYFDIEDIVIDDEVYNEDRIRWDDCRCVCIKRMGDKDYIELYGCPQCIGYCATKYEKIEFNSPI